MHIIHEFPEDFYGIEIRVIVLGYVRPEQNYPSLGKWTWWDNGNQASIDNVIRLFLDALITDIRTDVEVAKKSLQRPSYLEYKQNPLFLGA